MGKYYPTQHRFPNTILWRKQAHYGRISKLQTDKKKTHKNGVHKRHKWPTEISIIQLKKSHKKKKNSDRCKRD